MANTTVTQFSGLPMKALIGAPLKAATDANAMIARAQTQFILSNCFERISDDSQDLRPIMVNFQVTRQVIDHQGRMSAEPLSMTMSMPLMTLMPISSLAIETLHISFSMEVKSSREFTKESKEEIERRGDKQGMHRYHAHEFDTELHGTLSSTSSDESKQSSGANYKVILEAGQLPLPKGLTTMLDIFSKNIAPLPTKNSGEIQ